MANPTISGSSCSASLNSYKDVAGSVTFLSSTPIACHSGMVVRAVMGTGNAFLIYVDNVSYGVVFDNDITVGAPGVGIAYAPAGNYITNVQFGRYDSTPPTAINSQTIGTSEFPTEVDLQWQGVTDDQNGIGLWMYIVYRKDSVNPNYQQVATANQPQFADAAVSPGITYTYNLQACDFHWSCATTIITVQTPTTGIDARQVGVRPTGSYWGGGGENIDMRSGNLNYTIPLLKAKGRGWTLPFNLTYNSQNWRTDGGGTWNLGRDSGYGYGWKLQAGALVPVYTGPFSLHHYLFIDATSAEYRLDVQNGNIWTSKESVYMAYDSSTSRLYFPDGTFWVFGCTSAGTEQDAGVQYPTLVQDTNGNQVTITYEYGLNTTWSNSSARIMNIKDVASTSTVNSYNFAYSDEAIPHLIIIGSSVYPSDQYYFSYSGSPLPAPLVAGTNTALQFGSAQMLSTVYNNSQQLESTFAFNSSGELTSVTFPYGGSLAWSYGNATYQGNRTQREVTQRFLTMSNGGPQYTYNIAHDTWSCTPTVIHCSTTMQDVTGNGKKAWAFETNSAAIGFALQKAFEDHDLTSGDVTRTHSDFTWALDDLNTFKRPYISSTLTQLDPATSSQVQKRSDQAMDIYGNLTSMSLYDFGSPNAPANPTRTYASTYLANSAYSAQHIRNRLLTGTVTQAGQTTTLVSNTYDAGTLTTPSTTPPEHDPTYGNNVIYRGNLTSSTSPGKIANWSYDTTGNVVASNDGYGHSVSIAPDAATNSLPATITPNLGPSFATQLTYYASLAVNTATAPNNATSGNTYDSAGRLATTNAPTGAVTTYTYADTSSPPYETATTNSHWVKTTLDGLGRPIKVENGYNSGSTPVTVSVNKTVYAPCGCSPMGKMQQVSLPYDPSVQPDASAWTVYAYDGVGRTTSVTAADGSITRYAYSGNVVTATDAAGNWKKFTRDAFGNLTSVREPNPDYNPLNPSYASQYLDTSYTYDVLNHLTNVAMTRQLPGNSAVTQNRTFTYDTNQRLSTVTNPENGTVTYAYNNDGTLQSKTDAKGQKVAYSYNQYDPRISRIDRYPAGSNTPDVCQQVLLTWDVVGVVGYGWNNPVGRLSSASTGSATCTSGQIIEAYDYDNAGHVTLKAVQLTRNSVSGTLIGNFSYDNEGKLTDEYVPDPTILHQNYQRQIHYTYDAMSRNIRVTDYGDFAGQQTLNIVSNPVYGPANELKQVSYYNPANGGTVTETRSYNTRLQLTEINVPGIMDMVYTYALAPANSGLITKQKDNVSGEEISYQYDALNRLTAASTTDSSWGLSFSYDGFGNRLNQTVTKGIGLPMYQSVDMTTNRINTAGYAYDFNGNLTTVPGPSALALTYDVENRLQTVNGGSPYLYGLDNKRIVDWGGNKLYFYTPDGRKMNPLAFNVNGSTWQFQSLSGFNYYFGGKLVQSKGQLVITDKLGSVRANLSSSERFKYFPYGEENASPTTANDREKFATYTRDSSSGLDYADQRYYGSTYGRFLTPDPYSSGKGPGNPADSQSWNRYAYSGGDPVNRFDPAGRDWCDVDYFWLDCILSGGSGSHGIGDFGIINLSSLVSAAVGLALQTAIAGTALAPQLTISCELQVFAQQIPYTLAQGYHTYTETTVNTYTNGTLMSSFKQIFEATNSPKWNPSSVNWSPLCLVGQCWLNQQVGVPVDVALGKLPPDPTYDFNPTQNIYDSRLSAFECPIVAGVWANSAYFHNNTWTYGTFTGPNSNGFTFTLLSRAGVPLSILFYLGLNNPPLVGWGPIQF